MDKNRNVNNDAKDKNKSSSDSDRKATLAATTATATMTRKTRTATVVVVVVVVTKTTMTKTTMAKARMTDDGNNNDGINNNIDSKGENKDDESNDDCTIRTPLYILCTTSLGETNRSHNALRSKRKKNRACPTEVRQDGIKVASLNCVTSRLANNKAHYCESKVRNRVQKISWRSLLGNALILQASDHLPQHSGHPL